MQTALLTILYIHEIMFPFRSLKTITLTLGLLFYSVTQACATPLKIAYSDYPGWTALAIAEQKGWFKEAGIEVELLWFEYGPSMDAFTAGKVDAVTVTNGDALITGANGKKNTLILVTDYSDGNDMIIARAGIKSVKELKGKKIGVEIGLVDHLLLLNALEKNGLKETDVKLIPTPTNHTPQVLASGQVDAVVAWQPNANEALKAAPRAKPIYTSKDSPGLIYDALTVSPSSLKQRRADWVKFVKVWDKVVAYINDPNTHDDSVKIMAARAGVSAKEYKAFIPGTRFLTLRESYERYISEAKNFSSVAGSSVIANEFYLKNGVYNKPQKVSDYLDATVTADALK